MRPRTKRRRSGAPRGPATLSELVPRVYPSNEPEEMLLVRAIAWWDRHMPPRIARNSRPAKLQRGVLVIHALTSAWTHEIAMTLPQWTAKMDAAVPGIQARRARVQVGPLPPRPEAPPPPAPPVPPLDLTALPDDVAAKLVRIGDDRVRDAVAFAAAQSLAPRRTPRV